MDFKKQIETILKRETKLKEIPLEIPNNPDFGDYAFPCFILSKKLRKSPIDIAKDLQKIKIPKSIEKVEARGPYLNFFINKSIFIEGTIKKILKEKDNYGKSKPSKEIILIESPGPNTNKPLHLGHLRNMVLGISISKIQEAAGKKAINVDIINDRGIHIAKSALAYKKFGKNKKPNKKSDHFVGDYYILYSKKLKQHPELENEAQEMIRKYEAGDKQTINLFNKMNKWAINGFKETYNRVGINIKKTYLESEHYKKGKSIVLKGLKDKTFKKDKEGNITINLEKYDLGEKILLRKDGTSVYITQDIYLAQKRYKDFRFDKMIYIVGSEQIHHFKVLFTILEILGYKFAKKCYHLPYGMVYLPEGRMKSREGKVIDTDNLLDDIKELAKKEIIKRNKVSKTELEKRSKQIAQAAVKFFLLNRDSLKDFTFNPEESIKFEGNTGPYIQYTHARACSILRKAKTFKPAYRFNHEEQQIIKQLSELPDIIKQSAQNYKTHIITNYLLAISKKFNEYYQKYPVLNAESKIRNSRLTLVKAMIQTIKNGLSLLGIESPSKM